MDQKIITIAQMNNLKIEKFEWAVYEQLFRVSGTEILFEIEIVLKAHFWIGISQLRAQCS